MISFRGDREQGEGKKLSDFRVFRNKKNRSRKTCSGLTDNHKRKGLEEDLHTELDPATATALGVVICINIRKTRTRVVDKRIGHAFVRMVGYRINAGLQRWQSPLSARQL